MYGLVGGDWGGPTLMFGEEQGDPAPSVGLFLSSPEKKETWLILSKLVSTTVR